MFFSPICYPNGVEVEVTLAGTGLTCFTLPTATAALQGWFVQSGINRTEDLPHRALQLFCLEM